MAREKLKGGCTFEGSGQTSEKVTREQNLKKVRE